MKHLVDSDWLIDATIGRPIAVRTLDRPTGTSWRSASALFAEVYEGAFDRPDPGKTVADFREFQLWGKTARRNVVVTMSIPSGPVIADPRDRMLRFCREEHAYYDALPSGDPNRVEPLDVLAAVAVNGFFGANAATIREVHRGLAAACDPLLPAIPRDADLLAVDPSFADVAVLLRAAVAAPRVLIPVATKVLHRKRPALIPMLDNVILTHYLGRLPPATQDKTRASGVAVEVLRMFRADLDAVKPEIRAIVDDLNVAGFALSPVRVLEVLLWTEVEDRDYYR